MFSNLVARNSRRNRKDNRLYFSSMILSIIAFYIVLSLSNQGVMIFLKEIESDAVGRLLGIIPAFYVLSLFVLFYLVYFAGRIQIERRKHEFAVYLSLGMRRSRLFLMLMREELRNSVIALGIGLFIAVILSELISLVTVKLVGLGIIGHQFSFSLIASIFTLIGFLLVKLLSCFFLSFKVLRKEIGELLQGSPSVIKQSLPRFIYIISLALGILLLVLAYQIGMDGQAWQDIRWMSLMILETVIGNILLFYGHRIVIEYLVGAGSGSKKELHTFNLRQMREFVMNRSTTAAICSLMIFSAMCLFGAGIGFAADRTGTAHVLDYTFSHQDEARQLNAMHLREMLQQNRITSKFSHIVEIKIGAHKELSALSIDNLLEPIHRAGYTEERESLLHNLKGIKDCYFISLSSYNNLRKAANLSPIVLGRREARLYLDQDLLTDAVLLNSILEARPTIQQAGETLTLAGEVESLPLVADRGLTLAFALILPDADFETYTGGQHIQYVSAVLNSDFVHQKGLMQAILETNAILDQMPIQYESYLQGMGRQLFYSVAASYLSIYLAMIFLIVANTTIAVHFLMQQQKTKRHYQILFHLGASYATLCKSARKQINAYFGLAVVIALLNSVFGVMTLFAGLLPSAGMRISPGMRVLIAALAIALLGIIEYIYMRFVKKSSDRFLWILMKPKRIE